MNEPLARKIFHSLVCGYYQSEYIVLNDGNYLATIWTSSEAEAIKIFMDGGYQK